MPLAYLQTCLLNKTNRANLSDQASHLFLYNSPAITDFQSLGIGLYIIYLTLQHS